MSRSPWRRGKAADLGLQPGEGVRVEHPEVVEAAEVAVPAAVDDNLPPDEEGGMIQPGAGEGSIDLRQGSPLTCFLQPLLTTAPEAVALESLGYVSDTHRGEGPTDWDVTGAQTWCFRSKTYTSRKSIPSSPRPPKTNILDPTCEEEA